VNVYENDDAYMLNDDKDNAYSDDGDNNVNNLNNNMGNMGSMEFNDNENENENENEDMDIQNNNFEDDDEELEAEREAGNSNSNREVSDLSEEGTIRNKESANTANKVVNNVVNNATGNNLINSPDLNSPNTQQANSCSKDGSKSMSNLITLKYISVCQCCKENFNSNSNVPFLLKCGHFFCRSCIMNNFTEDDGQVFCPDDGAVARSISDLKLLNNLIINRTVDDEDDEAPSGFCLLHPEQRLSHYIEDTREVICVYCAFSKFKKNPKYEIKEIKDKCAEIIDDVDKILGDNQHYVEILQQTLKEIKDNKASEEERVANLYEEVIKYLEEKKGEMFESINTMFATNADKLSEKLDHFSNKMEEAEELKAHLVAVMNNSSPLINEVLQRYTQFVKEASDVSKLNLELLELKFSHHDEKSCWECTASHQSHCSRRT
jgi:hypothetical protein